MNPVAAFRRAALVGTIVITGVAGGLTAASAQVPLDFEDDYFKSELTDFEIEISGKDFVIDDVVQQNYSDGENEQVYIESDFASAQVSFFDDSDEPEDTIELWISDLGSGMDSLEVVDNGEDGDVIWYYAEGEYEDTDFVYYVQITEDVIDNVDKLESVLTVDGFLVDAVDGAQQDITVDGEAFMDNVDLDDLESLSGSSSSADETPEADDDDQGADGQNDSDRNRDRDNEDDDPDATQESGN
jgi:hypothetical protein